MSAPRELKNMPKGDIIDHGAKMAREDESASPSALRPHSTPKGKLAGEEMGPKVGGSDAKPR
jgi:hypothetical protein